MISGGLTLSISEKCLKCDGSSLRTGECDPHTCTTVFMHMERVVCPKCGAKLDVAVNDVSLL